MILDLCGAIVILKNAVLITLLLFSLFYCFQTAREISSNTFEELYYNNELIIVTDLRLFGCDYYSDNVYIPGI